MPHAGWTNRGYHPHFDAINQFQHVVFRLADSLPAKALGVEETGVLGENLFAAEAALDRGYGDQVLADARAASIVKQSLLHFDNSRYRLLAWCVMSTHVHVLFEVADDWVLAAVVQGWKSFTAHAINQALKRRGRVWARDYFDRAMRTESQVEAAIAYIEFNPVAAGLCAAPDEWPWSSASTAPKNAGGTPADQTL